MKKLLVIISLLSISCATFRHNAIPVQEQITALLVAISNDADKAVALNIMTKQQRQDFAKQIMLPSIDAASKINDCLLTGKCTGITVTLTSLSNNLLTGINTYIAQLPNSDIKNSLIAKLNSAITFVTNLHTTIGGKLETENSSLVNYLFVQEVLQ
jgi:hypothetical protein